MDAQAEKPILITRFNKRAPEWEEAVYYDVRSGEECRITTTGQSGRIPVRTYRQVLNQYGYRPEFKFNGPDGKPCSPWTRGLLQRRHIVAGEFCYCGKEFKRKLEQGPADHELDFKVRLYANGKVSANPEILNRLAKFSERELSRAARLHRKVIHTFCQGRTVRKSTYQKVVNFLKGTTKAK